MAQHSSPLAIDDAPLVLCRVPEDLLRDCDKKRKDALVRSVRKATNLYRRVSAVSYRDTHANHRKTRTNGSKCLVCLVTLVKSSKDKHRSGIKLRCPCNVRVCTMCFDDNPKWYFTEPHFTECDFISRFICGSCSTFQGAVEKVCCLWLCASCSSDCGTGVCVKCKKDVGTHRETCTLWPKSRSSADLADAKYRVCDVDKVDCYRREIRNRVIRKVSQSRHISNSDVRALFHETYAVEPCTCEHTRTSLCTSCTPVLTVMELLAKNPKPLMASFAERVIPGRALVRHTYNRALLLRMLNDQRLPFCVNGRNCKGMLLMTPTGNRSPLRSLMAPESYSDTREDGMAALRISPSACLLCLLFNQSSAVSHMLSSESLYLEPHPTGPVYYFNIKMAPDIGIPEVNIHENPNYIVNFQGSTGCFKPTFYYSWRDMLSTLQIDDNGNVTLSPLY